MELCHLMAIMVWIYSLEVTARRVMKSVTGPSGGFSSLVYHPGANGAISQMSISFSGTQLDDNFAVEEPFMMNKNVKELMHNLHMQFQQQQQQKSTELHYYKKRPISTPKIPTETKKPLVSQPIHQMFRNQKLNHTKSNENPMNLFKTNSQKEKLILKPILINRGQNKFQNKPSSSSSSSSSSLLTTTTAATPLIPIEIDSPSNIHDFSKWMSMKVKKGNHEGIKFHGSESAPHIITLNNNNNNNRQNDYLKNVRKPLVTQESLPEHSIDIYDPMSLWKTFPIDMPEFSYTFSPESLKKNNAIQKYPLYKFKKENNKLDQKHTASEYVNKLIQNVMNKTIQDPKLNQHSEHMKIPSFWKSNEYYKLFKNLQNFQPQTLAFSDRKQNRTRDIDQSKELLNKPDTKQNNKWSTQISETTDKFVPMLSPTSPTNAHPNTIGKPSPLDDKLLNDQNLYKLISNLGPNPKHEYQNGKHIITGPEEKGVFFRIIVNDPEKEISQS